MLTVACVLRSGGRVYDASWVRALEAGVSLHLAGAAFVCLTDLPASHLPGIASEPLVHDWPGWWSKVELFRPGLFHGPVLYLDLDTLVLGDLTDLAFYAGEFAALSDFYNPGKMASGVLAFTPGERTERLYGTFAADPGGIMRDHRIRSDYWYAKMLGDVDRLQDLFPGQIVSLKKDARHGAPEGVRLVCGHGQPRLNSTDAGWAYTHWRRMAA